MKPILLLLGCFFSLVVCGQAVVKDINQRDPDKVYLKDGLEISTREKFIEDCVQGIKQDKEQVIKNPTMACSCMLELMMPHLTTADFLKILLEETPDFMKAINQLPMDSKLELMTCILAASIDDTKDEPQNDEADKDEFTDATSLWTKDISKSEPFLAQYEDNCMKELERMMQEKGVKISEENAQNYCRCTLENIKKRGISLQDLKELGDVNSASFNELIVPCLPFVSLTDTTEVLEEVEEDAFPNWDTQIEGPDKEDIPISMIGRLGRVKVKMGKIEKYFLIDSGASSVIINSKMERELLLANQITAEHYISDYSYTLANGESVVCHRFLLPELSIGSFTAKNVEIAVIDERDSDLLLGQSFLNHFARWSLNNKTATLHLER